MNDPNAEFGSGWYSDHHFHYGYFLQAAATLARFDPSFFEANKASFDSFVRDICNPDSGDADFPFARHKDLFDGHSWASGLFQQSNGKGQESSSEVRIPFVTTVECLLPLFLILQYNRIIYLYSQYQNLN